MEDIFAKLYDMTAFSNIIADPSFLVMYAIAFILLYLGIKKHYEPLLLVPIAFGVLIANFPGGEMGVIQADENGMVMDTVEMKGQGFTSLTKEGAKVKAGTPLLKVDLEAIRAAGHPTATALIVTNSDDLPEISVAANGDAAAGTPVFKFKK